MSCLGPDSVVFAALHPTRSVEYHQGYASSSRLARRVSVPSTRLLSRRLKAGRAGDMDPDSPRDNQEEPQPLGASAYSWDGTRARASHRGDEQGALEAGLESPG